MGGTCSTHGTDAEFIQKFYSEKTEVKTPLGKPRYRWEDNIRMDLK
jgi:hypothetical protein